MNDNTEVYWEKKRFPEYPTFQGLKDKKPNWDTAKQVFDVDDKYQRFYGGILGNKVAEKEQKQRIREKERSAANSEQEEEYFNSLRIKLKQGTDSESDVADSPKNDANCSCDKKKEIVCQLCTVKKKGNSTSNSPRNRSNKGTTKNKTFSSPNSPKNTGTVGTGISFSKFKAS